MLSKLCTKHTSSTGVWALIINERQIYAKFTFHAYVHSCRDGTRSHKIQGMQIM